MVALALNSSAITLLSYDETDKTMLIRFNDGTAYKYEGVSQLKFNRLVNAKSMGSYFNANIKDKYDFIRVS